MKPEGHQPRVEQPNVRNIGIIAHVDAGKTTLTEQLLYKSGTIRSAGRVDHGTAQTDSMDVERERGISVRAAATCLRWKQVQVRVIDTPGHADFYAEVERSVSVLDGAILVVSAVEGVQLQTVAVWRALRELNVPTIIFINKLDREGADVAATLERIRTLLSPNIVTLQTAEQFDSERPVINDLAREGVAVESDTLEVLAGFSENLADRYLRDEKVSWREAIPEIRSLSTGGRVFPIFLGAAKLGLGVTRLLDGIIDFLPPPMGDPDGELSSVVFKVENQKIGRLSYVRIFDGSISQGELVRIHPGELQEKPARLSRLSSGGEYESTDRLEAGDIGVLFGMRCTKAGYVIGKPKQERRLSETVEPMLTASIEADSPELWNELLTALRELEDEDPLLRVEWREAQREINVQFFGEIQMQIIRELLASRFGISASFGEPGVLYKETPSKSGEARIEHRDNGFADIHIRVDPLPIGSGFEFESRAKADKVYFKFVKQIPQILELARQKGPQGWEVTDFKVTLIDGLSRYDLGTKPGDFKVVTPKVLQKALEATGTKLLEPMMSFEVDVPDEYGAQIYRALMAMRAQFDEATPRDGRLHYSGLVPFAETFANTATLYASSHGQGVLKTRFHGYHPVESLKH